MIHDVVKLVAKQRQQLVGLKLFENFEEAVQKVVEKGEVSKQILEDELNLIKEQGALAELELEGKESGKTPSASMVKLATQKDEIDSALEKLFHAIDQQQDLSVVSKVVKETVPKLFNLQEAANERLAEKVEQDKSVSKEAGGENHLDENEAKFFQNDLAEDVRQSYHELIDASNDLLQKGFGEGRAERVFSVVEKAQEISEQASALNPARLKRLTLWRDDEAEPQKPRNDEMLFSVNVGSNNDEKEVPGVVFESNNLFFFPVLQLFILMISYLDRFSRSYTQSVLGNKPGKTKNTLAAPPPQRRQFSSLVKTLVENYEITLIEKKFEEGWFFSSTLI